MGEKQVPALLKARVDAGDSMTIQKIAMERTGYIILSDFEDKVGFITSKVYPREDAAIADSNGAPVIEVKLTRVFK
jgi:hypothetical protein